MEMRLANKEDITELKEVWKLCFGDEDSYIEFYFENKYRDEETAVLLIDKTIVAMLTMIPVTMITEDEKPYEAAMLYAIATHPQYQKQGLAAQLMEFSNQYLMSKQVPISMLVPAKEELFGFYEQRGYETEFFVQEARLTRQAIENLSPIHLSRCSFHPAEPSEYNERRRSALKGSRYVDYSDKEISYQKKLSQLSDAEIFLIEMEEAEGCVVFERISRDEVIIKELLLPEKYFLTAVKQIPQIMPGEEFIVRTPPCLGDALGGILRPFGMIRENTKVLGSSARGGLSYLGFAFD